MAPSAVPVEGFLSQEDSVTKIRPTKRAKIEDPKNIAGDEDRELPVAIPPHPLRIKPSGNAYTATLNLKESSGFFTLLPDELLLQFLEYLDVSSLNRLGATCKALHAFTRAEELWKTLFVESHPSDFQWRGTWRSTYLGLEAAEESRIDCSNLFSDALHRPFFCAHTPLKSYSENIPDKNVIPRLSDLTREEFSQGWTDKPFILTSPVKEWPIYNKWSKDALLKQYANITIRAEAVDWPLNTYVDYMNNSSDESPLYLFDARFAEKMNLVTDRTRPDAAYWAPTCFGEDLFTLLGEQRPDHRWLIVGPDRSGSTFHKDPNATSAWNAVLTGSKYWLMFPSSPTTPPPPGVILSEDASEITSPLSIAEYMLGFHEMARKTPGCKEGICYAGEILHVPSGWFHLVLNLSESIALTQNFVPEKRLGDVLWFLTECPEQISGFSDNVENVFELFVERLKESKPEVLEEGLKAMERIIKGKKGKWEEIKGGADGEGESDGFSFGFGFSGEDFEDEET